jgi:hypothetical protein
METFMDCERLRAIEFPQSLMVIEFDAFGGCSSLTTLTLPLKMDSLDFSAFKDCKSLTTVRCGMIQKTVMSAFDGCNNIRDVYVQWTDPTPFEFFFSEMGANALLHVPRGCRQKYVQAGWEKYFTRGIVEGE